MSAGVTVTQADREAAWPYRPSCYKDDLVTRERWMLGTYDRAASVIQAFAQHRAAGQAELVEALAMAVAEMEVARPLLVAAGNHRRAATLGATCDFIRTALSRLSGEVGCDG